MRQWFKEIREERGFTQETIAKTVGVTRQFIGMIENGTANPHPEKAKAIANVLGFDWTRFYSDCQKNSA